MNLYEDQFSTLHNFNENNKVNKVLIIASTGRCGSHMLGHFLYETGMFGFPLEYVNKANLQEWQRRLNTKSLEDTILKLQKIRTSDNGVFAIKVHYQQVKQFGSFDHLLKFFPKAYFILLSRKDVLRQAISLTIANQTDAWIGPQKPRSKDVTYSTSQIQKNLKSLILDTASWRYILANNNCNFIELDFDQIKQELPNTTKKIALFMEIDITNLQLPMKPTTQNQSTSINSEWATLFFKERLDDELHAINKSTIFEKLKMKISKLFHSMRSSSI